MRAAWPRLTSRSGHHVSDSSWCWHGPPRGPRSHSAPRLGRHRCWVCSGKGGAREGGAGALTRCAVTHEVPTPWEPTVRCRTRRGASPHALQRWLWATQQPPGRVSLGGGRMSPRQDQWGSVRSSRGDASLAASPGDVFCLTGQTKVTGLKKGSRLCPGLSSGGFNPGGKEEKWRHSRPGCWGWGVGEGRGRKSQKKGRERSHL